MAFRFIAVAAALACINVAVCNPVAHAPLAYPYAHSPCPAPLPVIEPVYVQSVIPAPAIIGPQAPGVIEHASYPYEINYFEKPWVVKHKQSAALNVFTETPVVIDEYAAPAFAEVPAPPAVIVEEVCGAPAAPIAAAPLAPLAYAAPAAYASAPLAYAPTPCTAPALLAPAPCL